MGGRKIPGSAVGTLTVFWVAIACDTSDTAAACSVLGDIGSFLGGLAALLAVVFAVYKLPAELSRWRSERRDTKRAEVAGDVGVNVVRFAEALRSLSRPIGADGMTITGNKPFLRALRELLTARVQTIEGDKEAFLSAWRLAEVYLSEEINSNMAELWRLLDSIISHMELVFAHLASDTLGTEEGTSAYEKAFQVHPEIDKIKNRLKELLRPYALLE